MLADPDDRQVKERVGGEGRQDTFQKQRHPFRQLPANPAHGERSQYMPMSHQQHIARRRSTFWFPNGCFVEPRPYISNQPI